MEKMSIIQKRAVYAKWFHTGHLANDIKKKSIKGGINTILSQVLSSGLNLLSTIIIARLVIPESFGLIAMVSTFTGFVLIFKDLGFSVATIQRTDVNQKEMSSLFWFNIGISSAISLLVAAFAPILVSFYDEPLLLHITLVMAVTIFISGFSLQHSALLKRQMRFKRLSYAHIFSTVISILVGIVMAYLKFDYWALVGLSFAYSLAYSIFVWLACDWRPSLVIDLNQIKGIAKFGAGITGFDIVNYFSRNADNMLVGRYYGAGPLGLYSRAYQLLMLPLTQLRLPLNNVALPALSSLKNQQGRYRDFYARYVFTLAFFSMPLVAYLFVFSEEIVVLMLGKQWIEASYIFQLLAISSLIQPVAGTTGTVMITMGYTRRYFNWGVISSIITVGSFFVGIQWGIQGLAIGYAIANYAILIPSLTYSFKGTPIKLSDFFRETGKPFLFSIIGAGACLLFRYCFEGIHPITLLAGGLFVGAASYLLPWMMNAQLRDKLKKILEIKKFLS